MFEDNLVGKRRIIMTRHASQRILEREILESQIEAVINNPIETIYDEDSGNHKSYGMATHPFTQNKTYLMVVHSKFNTQVTIITAMWQTKGGLRNNGFNQV